MRRAATIAGHWAFVEARVLSEWGCPRTADASPMSLSTSNESPAGAHAIFGIEILISLRWSGRSELNGNMPLS